MSKHLGTLEAAMNFFTLLQTSKYILDVDALAVLKKLWCVYVALFRETDLRQIYIFIIKLFST